MAEAKLKKHTKVYLSQMGYETCDWIPCEVCAAPQEPGIGDVHHIDGRRIKNANHIDNLIFLCRYCHQQAHGINGKISKQSLKQIIAWRLQNDYRD